jgi:hypothetical protein
MNHEIAEFILWAVKKILFLVIKNQLKTTTCGLHKKLLRKL